ncbi:MAG TPA: hypothetical protein VKZ44_03450 [Taishania sp.]|nr:hypothetical protein [Taishania sp.]
MLKAFVLTVVFVLSFSKAEFFKAMESSDAKLIVSIEQKVASSSDSDEKRAYYGAILMKSADFQKTPGEKLKKFKQGKELLESVIASNPNQVEYRFLRLMVQENAPKIVKYDQNIEEDCKLIKSNLSKVSSELKNAISNYTKTSKNLKL